MRHLLGISAYYHDSAAALLRDGRIVAAAQEERFSRRKNDERFPARAVAYCLAEGGLAAGDLDGVVFYDKPITKFARMLETYLAVAPGGWRTFPRVVSSWLGEKLNLRGTLRDEIPGLQESCPVWFTQHHRAHAASAFFPSPFETAAVLTVDGVGEYATTTIGRGAGDELELLEELRFPHSLGLLYSAFTAYCGFRVNSGEYKLMGLAPYGEPRYAGVIRERLLDLKEDGSFWLDLEYFDFLRGLTMTHRRFDALFGGPPRKPEAPLEARHADVARSIQEVAEEVLLRLAKRARERTGESRLCLAGGVALNCVANGRILRELGFEGVWVQPAAGDAGGALGAALEAWHSLPESVRGGRKPAESDAMQGAFLGPAYGDDAVEAVLRQHGAVYEKLSREVLEERVVELLAEGKVVGWFQGRLEFGPRALGHRSILADPRRPEIQSLLNRKVKFRESFRPFAPAVLRERVGDYFDLEVDSPYMLLVAPVRAELRRPVDPGLKGFDRLREPPSTLPAVTHVDGSARVQTVDAERNPEFYRLLKRFEARTGCGVLVNTSFNVRGEPVVASPDDAYRCWVNTAMDWLAIGSFLLERDRQPQERPRPVFDAVPD